jgi:hypothetical protein
MRSSDIPVEPVERCFLESFENKTNMALSDNAFLKVAHSKYEMLPVNLWPSLFINGMLYKVSIHSIILG